MNKEYWFSVIIEPCEEGGYYAECPTLPGCVTQGETYAEAVGNLQDAIRGYVESLLAHGEPIPGKKSRQRYKVELPVSVAA